MVSQSAQKTQSSHATRGPGASRTITKAKDSVAESSKPKRTAGGNKRKRDSDSDRQSQKVRKDLREKLAAAQQTRTHKQQKIDEFLEELNAGPPQWAVQRGPARVEKWRRDQEQRIKRYEGELQSVNAKRADLEKTRIVFLALKDYYGKRHGDEKKFRDLLAAGYDNPIGVVAHFWLRESTEVRNALFVKCIELSAKEFEKDPQKLTQWLDAFDTVEAFDEFFELKLDENRLRRPVGK
ncbi:hypothetical protein AAVH_18165 [Aphelenchoides avenae]|nr:hypothetical protein AAVH_18165 [Aphelenchus avenae]